MWMYFCSMSYCTNQFLADILSSDTGFYWGKKPQYLLKQNPNLLSYHVVASVTHQFLCWELELERTLIFFLCDGILHAFSFPQGAHYAVSDSS